MVTIVTNHATLIIVAASVVSAVITAYYIGQVVAYRSFDACMRKMDKKEKAVGS